MVDRSEHKSVPRGELVALEGLSAQDGGGHDETHRRQDISHALT